MRFLNVGGGDKHTDVPARYLGWEHVRLDINPEEQPDIVCDGRRLDTLPAKQFDAVYCAHNLEHYHRHEVPQVLAGFRHVLKDDGFVHIVVPNLDQVMRLYVEKELDIDSLLYQSAAGPISVHDVLFGYGKEIEQLNNPFYVHKTGFTPRTLGRALHEAGFQRMVIYVRERTLDIESFSFHSPGGV